MDFKEEFKMLTNQYDDAVFLIFKQIIDDAIEKCKNDNLNPILTFIFVNDTLKSTYIDLALIKGIIKAKEGYNEAHIKLIISENVEERIYNYIAPITDLARKSIKKEAKNILYSSSLEELKSKYTKLSSLLSNKTIQENSYVYEGIQL